MKAFTNTCNDTATHNVCLDDLLTTSRAMHDTVLDMFSSIRIRVDPQLKAKNWHVAVSEDLWKDITEHEKKQNASKPVLDISRRQGESDEQK